MGDSTLERVEKITGIRREPHWHTTLTRQLNEALEYARRPEFTTGFSSTHTLSRDLARRRVRDLRSEIHRAEAELDGAFRDYKAPSQLADAMEESREEEEPLPF